MIKVICDEMKKRGEDFRMLIMPDHPTPICIRTHSSDPVPYLLYDSTKERRAIAFYNEKEAAAAGNMELDGYRLIENLFQ